MNLLFRPLILWSKEIVEVNYENNKYRQINT